MQVLVLVIMLLVVLSPSVTVLLQLKAAIKLQELVADLQVVMVLQPVALSPSAVVQ